MSALTACSSAYFLVSSRDEQVGVEGETRERERETATLRPRLVRRGLFSDSYPLSSPSLSESLYLSIRHTVRRGGGGPVCVSGRIRAVGQRSTDRSSGGITYRRMVSSVGIAAKNQKIKINKLKRGGSPLAAPPPWFPRDPEFGAAVGPQRPAGKSPGPQPGFSASSRESRGFPPPPSSGRRRRPLSARLVLFGTGYSICSGTRYTKVYGMVLLPHKQLVFYE